MATATSSVPWRAGLADSGSVDGYVWDVLAEREPALASQTRVVLRSPLMGFPPIACLSTRQTSPSVIALGEALTSLHQDQAGKDVLGLLRLDGFTTESPGLYDSIATMFDGLPA